MSSEIKTRINLRKDVLANWEEKNPVLGSGEMAIVEDGNGDLVMKIGNGISAFNQLPYLYQQEFKTEKLTAKEATVKSLSQGYNVSSTPTSLATGVFSEANGSFGVVHGIEAQILSSDDYAFVFNGTNLSSTSDRYSSHGTGTFSINPVNGLRGFYIGQKNLDQIFTDSTTKTWIKSPDDSDLSDGAYSNLSVIKLTKEDYDNQVLNDKLSESAIYLVSSEFIDAYGQQIKNVRMEDGTYEGTAATKTYVDDVIANEKNERVSSDKSFESLVADLSNQVSALSLSLSDEADVRINAVSKLINDLSAEARTREEQDKILSASILSSGCSFTDDVKVALADCLENVVWRNEDSSKFRTLKRLLGLTLTESIWVDDRIAVEEGGTKSISIIVIPETIGVNSVEWWSSDESIATVSNGTITGVTLGSATIYAAKDGIRSMCNVEVTESSTEYSVSCNLENCTGSNTSVTTRKGKSYTNTITPNEGYKLGGVVCTMGGVEQGVTGGVVSISSVTGEIVITAAGTALKQYSITNNLTQCTNSNSETSVYECGSYVATISPTASHRITQITCTMGGVEQTVSENTISIPSVSGDIVITAIAEETTSHSITNSLVGCSNASDITELEDGSEYSTHFIPDTGYILSDITCTMGGNPVELCTGYELVIPSVSGDIKIDAEATQGIVETLTSDFSANSSPFVFDENPISLSDGDYVEVQVYLSSSSSSASSSAAQNILGVGNDISNWIQNPAAKYLFYYYQSSSQLEIDMITSGTTTSNMYWSRVLLEVASDSTLNIKVTRDGIFVNDEFLNPDTCQYQYGGRCDNTSYKQAIYDILTQNKIQVGACQGDVTSSLKYDFIRVVRRNAIETVFVSSNLTKCINRNPSTTCTVGTRYSATISPDLRCRLSSISVKMGGLDLPDAVDLTTGRITVENVTERLTITAVAVDMEYITVAENLDSTTDGWMYELSGLDLSAGDVVDIQMNLSNVTDYENTMFIQVGDDISAAWNLTRGINMSLYSLYADDSNRSSDYLQQLKYQLDTLMNPGTYGGSYIANKYHIENYMIRFSVNKQGPWIEIGDLNCISSSSQYGEQNDSERAIASIESHGTFQVGVKTYSKAGVHYDYVRVYKANGVSE